MPEPLFWVLLSLVPGAVIWLGVSIGGRPGTIVTLLGITGWSLAWAYVPLTAQARLGGPLTPVFFGLGLWLMLAGLALSGLAGWRIHPVIGWSQVDPTELLTTGPYGFVRHPIYAGLVLAYLGWSLVWGALYAVLLSPVLFLLLRGQAWLEERIWLEPTFGEAFRAYRARVPAFFPVWLWAVLIILLVVVAASAGLSMGIAPL